MRTVFELHFECFKVEFEDVVDSREEREGVCGCKERGRERERERERGRGRERA